MAVHVYINTRIRSFLGFHCVGPGKGKVRALEHRINRVDRLNVLNFKFCLVLYRASKVSISLSKGNRSSRVLTVEFPLEGPYGLNVGQ